MDEKTKDLIIDNKKLRNKITELHNDNVEIAQTYYKLLFDFNKLQHEKRQLEKDVKKAYYNFEREIQALKKGNSQQQQKRVAS